MSLPDVRVYLGFGSGVATALADVSWTEVTDYVEAQEPIDISRGRADELSDLAPAQASLTLDNSDGRFTPGLSTSPHFPNVLRGTPLKVEYLPSGEVAYVPRFVGWVDEWEVDWPDGGDSTCVARVSATSGLERLRQRVMKSVVEETYSADPNLYAYFPLGEGSSATSATDLVPSPHLGTLNVTAGTVEFGANTGPGTDAMSAPQLTAATLESSRRFAGGFDRVLLEATCRLDTIGETMVPATIGGAVMTVNTDGVLGGGWMVDGVLDGFTGPNIVDNETHHLALAIHSYTSTGASLWVDGVKVAEGSVTALDGHDGSLLRCQKITGTLSHLALTDLSWVAGAADVTALEAMILERATALLDGFTADSTDERLLRWLGWTDSTEDVTVEPGTVASLLHYDTTDKSLAEAIQVLQDTEQGLFVEKRSGEFEWQSRDHRYNAPSVVTLSATDGAVGADLTALMNDLGLVNLATVEDGTSTVTARNAESVAQYGTYGRTLTALYGDDIDAQSLAEWVVNLYGEPAPRVPTVTVDASLMPAATQQALADLEVGDLITLTDMPAQFPWAEQDFFVEGWSESVGFDAWRITLNLSSSSATASVWVLDSPTYSQLDTTTRLAL